MKKILKSIYNYLLFFAMIAFVITCCMMLFVSILSESLNVELTGENLGTAASLTFANVVFLSAVYTLIDAIRRKITVERPVKRIVNAAEKMTKGDFSVRIKEFKGINNQDSFNVIIKCLNEMAEELSGVETLRSDFVANVSHELKSPLAVIRNYAMLIEKGNLSESEQKEYSALIGDAAVRLSDLVSNILRLNKLENQNIFPQKEKYDIGEQLCECLIGFESEWEKKNLSIKPDIEENVFVNEDRELMGIVWNNLLSNAIKFTPENGEVAVALLSEGDNVTVKISDTGCGISKAVGERMFDKFYQGDSSHATKGNGLGLALVKRISDITGFCIDVKSQIGEGTAFSVKLRRITNEENG